MISSCSETDKNFNQSIDGLPNSFGGSYTNLWNSVNPYDSIGFIHNNILDYAISQYGGPVGAQIFNQNLSTLISSYCYSTYSQTISPSSIDSSSNNYYSVINDAMNDSLTFSEYLEETFSPNINTSLMQIFSVMSTCTSQSLVNATIGQIKLIENNVAINANYSQHEKNVIFAVSAGAKFSLVYWADATNNENSEWTNWGQDYDPEFEQPDCIEWVVAAAADAIKIGIEVDKGNQDPVDIAAKAALSSALAYLSWTAEWYGATIGAAIGFIGSLF